jgi:hypothetical protein
MGQRVYQRESLDAPFAVVADTLPPGTKWVEIVRDGHTNLHVRYTLQEAIDIVQGAIDKKQTGENMRYVIISVDAEADVAIQDKRAANLVKARAARAAKQDVSIIDTQVAAQDSAANGRKQEVAKVCTHCGKSYQRDRGGKHAAGSCQGEN